MAHRRGLRLRRPLGAAYGSSNYQPGSHSSTHVCGTPSSSPAAFASIT